MNTNTDITNTNANTNANANAETKMLQDTDVKVKISRISNGFVEGTQQITKVSEIINLINVDGNTKAFDKNCGMVFYEKSKYANDIFDEIKSSLGHYSTNNKDFITLENGGFIHKESILNIRIIEMEDERVIVIIGLNSRTLFSMSSYDYNNIDNLKNEVSEVVTNKKKTVNWNDFLID
ncbi:hypothetical protein [Marinomonas sp. TW1]|uniref:hypothetical protein n=1 Tax=Marinomonas sp. TW1 TaxID=1561203 RepID=UPI0007AFA5F4|nr:hypothetical protein [Marinomonas sp. TW1]KZN13942.1 hypothetical protein OA79_07565 [Marinomonas sp. TW1]